MAWNNHRQPLQIIEKGYAAPLNDNRTITYFVNVMPKHLFKSYDLYYRGPAATTQNRIAFAKIKKLRMKKEDDEAITALKWIAGGSGLVIAGAYGLHKLAERDSRHRSLPSRRARPRAGSKQTGSL